jgi:hypothetical protein
LYKMVKASRTIQKPDKNVWSLNGSKQDGWPFEHQTQIMSEKWPFKNRTVRFLNVHCTVMIQIPDALFAWGCQWFHFPTASKYRTICPVFERSGFRIIIMKTRHFCLVFKWSTSLDCFIINNFLFMTLIYSKTI